MIDTVAILDLKKEVQHPLEVVLKLFVADTLAESLTEFLEECFTVLLSKDDEAKDNIVSQCCVGVMADSLT